MGKQLNWSKNRPEDHLSKGKADQREQQNRENNITDETLEQGERTKLREEQMYSISNTWNFRFVD